MNPGTKPWQNRSPDAKIAKRFQKFTGSALFCLAPTMLKAPSNEGAFLVLDDQSTNRWLTSRTTVHASDQELPIKGAKPRTTPISASQRFRILRRYAFSCVYCGRGPQNDGAQLRVGHVIPRISGGSNDDGNLGATCRECNLGKGITSLTS